MPLGICVVHEVLTASVPRPLALADSPLALRPPSPPQPVAVVPIGLKPEADGSPSAKGP